MNNHEINDLNNGLLEVEKIAQASKIQRMLAQPFRYLFSISFREFIYPITKKGIPIIVNTFLNIPMKIVLPAGMDIYLTGGKSDESEIRLARYLINNLSINNHFIDVGAHFGYFSLLASILVKENGKVYSFEASKETFKILRQNTKDKKNIYPFNAAISNTNSEIIFYEFPSLFSEYNTSEIEQFKKTSWYKKFSPNKIIVGGLTIDDIVQEHNLNPKIIKIDVEGAEFTVILGAINTLKNYKPIIAMEYLTPERHNQNHRKAYEFLINNGYNSFIIDKNGNPNFCKEIENYLFTNKLESDNIVFL